MDGKGLIRPLVKEFFDRSPVAFDPYTACILEQSLVSITTASWLVFRINPSNQALIEKLSVPTPSRHATLSDLSSEVD